MPSLRPYKASKMELEQAVPSKMIRDHEQKYIWQVRVI